MAHEIMKLVGTVGERANRPITRAVWPKTTRKAQPAEKKRSTKDGKSSKAGT